MAISATGTATIAAMEFLVLGPLEVLGSEGPISIPSGRQRSVLALLVLNLGRTVTSEQLIEDVWGLDPPPSARQALRVHIAGLRRLIGADRIETRPNGYRLRAVGAATDVARFETLVASATHSLAAGQAEAAAAEFAAALALWRGAALADLAPSDLARGDRARLDELRSVAAEHWVDAELASGRHLEQVPELRRLVADAPLREAFQARLMLALYRSGRQADALAVYHAAREVLDRELGVEPGPELEAAQRAVLTHDPGAVGLGRGPGSRTRGDAPAPRSLLLPAPTDAVAASIPYAAPGSQASGDGAPPVGGPSVQARQTITALAVKLRGSTEVDPESASRPTESLLDRIRSIVLAHGGTAHQAMGEGIVAIFGLPVVHEDDPRRAMRAALQIRSVVKAGGDGGPMSFSAGLATGEVVTRQTPNTPTRVVGDVEALAGGLAQAAHAGEVLLSDTSRVLLRQFAEVGPAEQIGIADRPRPVTASRLIAERQDRVDAHLRFDSPLVGRQRELAQLSRALDEVIEDQACQLFTLLGPAGAGKSRLVHEFLGSVRDGARVFRGRCLPYGEQATLWPISEVVRQAAGIGDGDDAAAAYRKIAALVSQADRPSLMAEHLASAIGIEASSSTSDATDWAIRSLFNGLARDRPLVLVFDDVQWGEPAFLDLVEYLADTARDVPILFLCIARTELLDVRPGWSGGKLNATSVLLRPLGGDDVAHLLANLLGGLPVSPGLTNKIADAAEGNPLFVEEFLAKLVEDGLVRRDDEGWVATVDLAGVPAPGSIMALLAARLGQVPPAERSILERASVVGKVFSRSALDQLVGGLAQDVETSLAMLVRRELIRRDAPAADIPDTYRFKHILIRDAAYAGLAKTERIKLHERLADWLARGATLNRALDDEVIGGHLEQAYRYRTDLGPADAQAAAVGRRAAVRLAAAGRHAHVRGDSRTARTLFERATDLLAADSPERLRLLVDQVESEEDDGDFAAAQMTLYELSERAARLGQEQMRWQALLAGIRLDYLRGLEPDLAMAQSAVHYFERTGDDRALGSAWYAVAEIDLQDGRLAAARRSFERAAHHAELGGDLHGQATYRNEIASVDLEGPATVTTALETATALLSWARATGQPATEAIAIAHHARLRAMEGDFPEARRLLGVAIGLTEDVGFRVGSIGNIPRWIGRVEWLAGDYAAAEAGLRQGYEAAERLAAHSSIAFLGGELARVVYLQGRLDEAHNVTLTAERYDSGRWVVTGILWRGVRAMILARRGEAPAAIAMAEKAVAAAAATDLLWIHGRALEDMAEVLLLSDRPEDARPLVQEAIGLYERKGATVLVKRARQRLVD
jgi:DNA-binding SARP family transcriptional activator